MNKLEIIATAVEYYKPKRKNYASFFLWCLLSAVSGAIFVIILDNILSYWR